MTEILKRRQLVAKFQKWLDTNPNSAIIAAECATIAEKYAKRKKGEIIESLEILISQNEDDFDRGQGKYILRNWIEANK